MPSAHSLHQPVLLDAVISSLVPRPAGLYLDATLGGGGHAEALLQGSAPDGHLLGLDRDPAALARCEARLERFADRLILEQTSFDHMAEVAERRSLTDFDGILMDLGISSDQLDDPERGLSLRRDGPLDMRMDPASATKAEDLVNQLPESELADLIYAYGEERGSRRIARHIVRRRPLSSTLELAEVVRSALASGRKGKRGPRRIDPATRTFQALRIAVNDELGMLERALEQAIGLLAKGGRLAVISFHSLEDRMVKRRFKRGAQDCTCPPQLPECRCVGRAELTLINRRPITADSREIDRNPRARSAKLRVAERAA